jgi:hypothetical protein
MPVNVTKLSDLAPANFSGADGKQVTEEMKQQFRMTLSFIIIYYKSSLIQAMRDAGYSVPSNIDSKTLMNDVMDAMSTELALEHFAPDAPPSKILKSVSALVRAYEKKHSV